jgi:enoyl-CoA hydratase/carnithine racemase
MINLEKKESIYFLTMDAGENRWNTTFVREFSKALDEVEKDDGPGALITTSSDQKFFSNGLDLDWIQSPSDFPKRGDREIFGEEFMYQWEGS